MKKISYVIIFLLIAVGVTAVEVDCDRGWWDSDICRDFELQDEFDEVTDDIKDNSDTITTVEKYINSNSGTWSNDRVGGGISTDYYWRMTVGKDKKKISFIEEFDSFLDYIEDVFVPWKKIDELEARIQILEKKTATMNNGNLDQMTGMITAKRIGKIVITPYGYTCKPNLSYCYKLGDI